MTPFRRSRTARPIAERALERSAWVRHVLAVDVPDADAYLADQLFGAV